MNNPCLAKLKPGEPFFVLRGQDLLAPDLVKDWVGKAAVHGASDAKLQMAWADAHAMEQWPNRKFPD